MTVPALIQRHGLAERPDIASALAPAFGEVQATEGTLWLLDEEDRAMVPVWNSGPNPEAFVGSFRQPLDAGLISLVCVAEQALCENDVFRHVSQDPSLDRKLGVLTCSMIAVPLRLGGSAGGVVSCVKLKPDSNAPNPAPFTSTDLARIAKAVADWSGSP